LKQKYQFCETNFVKEGIIYSLKSASSTALGLKFILRSWVSFERFLKYRQVDRKCTSNKESQKFFFITTEVVPLIEGTVAVGLWKGG